jgi:hypothetical protein
MYRPRRQSDPIGRIFAYVLGATLLGAVFLKITEVVQVFGYFSAVQVTKFDKRDWATFWAIFYQLIWSPCTPLRQGNNY